MLEAGLYSLLTSDATVSSLIGTRLFPDVIAERDMPVNAGDSPAVQYFDATGRAGVTLDRHVTGERRIQFDVFAVTRIAAHQVATACHNVLLGYTGTLTDGTRIISCLLEGEMSHFEDDSRVYRRMFEYRIQFSGTL